MQQPNRTAEYTPPPGFLDLRDWALPKRVFMRLWEVQKWLYHVEKHKTYFQEYDPVTWAKAQEVAGAYQAELFRYKQRPRQGFLFKIGRPV